MSDCCDKQFGDYAKTEQTKHQFCFDAVEKSEDSPLGVKTTYRAYSADDVIEIVQKKGDTAANQRQNLLLQQHRNEHDTKLIPVQVFNKWYPEETVDEPEGMYIMQKLPPSDRVLVPQEFVSDSRSVFFATFKKVKEMFQATQPEVVLQWEQFAQRVPLNNSAEDYFRKNP